MNTLELIRQDLAEAAAPRSHHEPLMLFLKDGHKVEFRPLTLLCDAIYYDKHDTYNEGDPHHSISAICRATFGETCTYCEQLKDNPALRLKRFYYLPVYLHSLTINGELAMTTPFDGNPAHHVSGLRLLEMRAGGRLGDILNFFVECTDEAAEWGPITACNFTIKQVGQRNAKKFTCGRKKESPMSEETVEIYNHLDLQDLRHRLIEFDRRKQEKRVSVADDPLAF